MNRMLDPGYNRNVGVSTARLSFGRELSRCWPLAMSCSVQTTGAVNVLLSGAVQPCDDFSAEYDASVFRAENGRSRLLRNGHIYITAYHRNEETCS
jgi:hypothetical protein